MTSTELLAYFIIGLIIYRIFIVPIKILWSKRKERWQRENPETVPTSNSPYESIRYAHKHILTENEQRFYHELKKMADSHHLLVCPKVGLKELFVVKTSKANYMLGFNKINRKHIDFILCDQDLRLKLGIELDDRSHELDKTGVNDSIKDMIFRQNGIPLVRVKAKYNYTSEYIDSHLRKVIDSIAVSGQ